VGQNRNKSTGVAKPPGKVFRAGAAPLRPGAPAAAGTPSPPRLGGAPNQT